MPGHVFWGGSTDLMIDYFSSLGFGEGQLISYIGSCALIFNLHYWLHLILLIVGTNFDDHATVHRLVGSIVLLWFDHINPGDCLVGILFLRIACILFIWRLVNNVFNCLWCFQGLDEASRLEGDCSGRFDVGKSTQGTMFYVIRVISVQGNQHDVRVISVWGNQHGETCFFIIIYCL